MARNAKYLFTGILFFISGFTSLIYQVSWQRVLTQEIGLDATSMAIIVAIFMMGLGFTFVLLLLGGLREVIGQGTLFANAHLLFGDMARDWTITLVGDYRGFLLAILPPGAFIGLGLLIAVKNIIDDKVTKPSLVSVGEVVEQS